MIVLLPTWFRIAGVDRQQDRTEIDWIDKVFYAILYVSIARCIKLVLDKFMIGIFIYSFAFIYSLVQIQKHNFWANLYDVLWREKVLRSILQPQKKDKINRYKNLSNRK